MKDNELYDPYAVLLAFAAFLTLVNNESRIGFAAPMEPLYSNLFRFCDIQGWSREDTNQMLAHLDILCRYQDGQMEEVMKEPTIQYLYNHRVGCMIEEDVCPVVPVSCSICEGPCSMVTLFTLYKHNSMVDVVEEYTLCGNCYDEYCSLFFEKD
jgi:hypothetical protein